MTFTELFKKLLSEVDFCSQEELALKSTKYWFNLNGSLYVKNAEIYGDCLGKIYGLNKNIASRFSQKTVFSFINSKVPKIKRDEGPFPKDILSFFEPLLSIKPRDLLVTAPISGIRLDYGIREFELSIYKFGYLNDLKIPISNEKGMYIRVMIKDVFDNEIAISKATNAFFDFARLIVFMSGKQDKSILISTGLPLRPDLNHERMYVSTSSYQITDENGTLDSATISNTHLEKVPVNNDFFVKNKYFYKLWSLNEKKIQGYKLSDIESRLVNSAIALGESAITPDKRNSIIYTCMSLEIMFSHDEASLFQRSIGEKLSDIFVFIVAKDKDARLKISKAMKKVYSLRSAIVHGGNKDLTDENLIINELMRAAINEILNNDKFKAIKNIGEIYEALKEAQYSY
ncbi:MULTISPECIES: HEPN domain-containing protein [Aeromonas]|uniref:HEPN domain-containing protein n=1 Tax=Aeromonas TaxID=642 RepID=UPI001303BBF4|nr:HEPN domain-containing protein [Aeromonas hydrophila]QGZ73932.1 hypothetical protein GQR50_16160 [Aeromonas hydrophila]